MARSRCRRSSISKLIIISVGFAITISIGSNFLTTHKLRRTLWNYQDIFINVDHENSTTSRIDSTTSQRDDVLHQLDEISRGLNYEERSKDCRAPKRFYTNRIVWLDTDKDSKVHLIPRILHVSFGNRCLPQDIYRNMELWEKNFPNHSIFLHDDDSVQALFDRSSYPMFPNFKRILKCVFYKGAMTIDIWRVLILFLYGGVYTDIDNYPTDKFHEDTIPYDVSSFFFSDAWNRPSQWFMAFEPRHPIMYISMRSIVYNILSKIDIKNPKLVQMTGPHVIFHSFRHFYSATATNVEIDNSKELTGLHGLKSLKLPRRDVSKYLKSKEWYNDIVPHPYNSTLNVTRGDRVDIESKTAHWTKTIHRTKKKLKSVPNNCEAYLSMIDKDPSLKVEGNF